MRRDDEDVVDPEEALRKRLTAQYAPEPDPVMEMPQAPTVDVSPSAPDPSSPSVYTPTDRREDPAPRPPAPTPQPAPTPAPDPTPQPAPAPAPQPTPSPQPTPTPDAQKIPALSPHASWIAGIFKEQGKTATAADIAYWENVITRANGDMGYVRMRMLQPDTGGQPPPATTNTAGGLLNYQQQLAYIQQRLGRVPTAAEMAAIRQKFGGTETDATTPAILDQVIAFMRGSGGSPGNQGTDTGHPTGNLGDDTRIHNVGPAGDFHGDVITNGQPTTGPQGLWGPEFMAQVRALLMERLKGASGPVDANSPNIASAMTAAQDAASRQTDKERTQLAEHLYAQGGLNTDAITQGIQQSGERNAVGLGGLRATLIQKEVEGRRGELQNLLQLALQSGDAEMTNAIRLQLAALDAQLRREGYGIDMAKYMAYLNAQAGNNLIGPPS